MTLEEIFELTARGVLSDRPIEDELYSDAGRAKFSNRIIINALDVAQDEFTNFTYCIMDENTPGTSVYDLEVGNPLLTLHESVFQVNDFLCTYILDAEDGEKYRLNKLVQNNIRDLDDEIPKTFRTIIRGSSPIQINLWPTPAKENLKLYVSVYRRPLLRFASLIGDECDVETRKLIAGKQCEIPSLYHINLPDKVMFELLKHRKVDKEVKQDIKDANDRWEEAKLRGNQDVHRIKNDISPVASNSW